MVGRSTSLGPAHILCGFSFLHRNGVNHRDIKPENILLQWQSENCRLHAAPSPLLAQIGLTKCWTQPSPLFVPPAKEALIIIRNAGTPRPDELRLRVRDVCFTGDRAKLTSVPGSKLWEMFGAEAREDLEGYEVWSDRDPSLVLPVLYLLEFGEQEWTLPRGCDMEKLADEFAWQGVPCPAIISAFLQCCKGTMDLEGLEQDPNFGELLFEVVRGGHVKLLLNFIQFLANSERLSQLTSFHTGQYGNTLLHEAVDAYRHKVVELLLNEGNMPIDLPNKAGWTPLYSACHGAQYESSTIDFGMVQLLLFHGASVNNKVLVLLCRSHHENAAKVLRSMLFDKDILRPGVLINGTDKAGRTPLHNAVKEPARLELVKLLLEHPEINVNAKDKQRNTPLHVVARSWNSTNAETSSALWNMLIESGAKRTIINCKGYRAQDPEWLRPTEMPTWLRMDNMPVTMTRKPELAKLFQEFQVLDILIKKQRWRTFGVVQLATHEELQAALARYNGLRFQDRILTVTAVTPDPPRRQQGCAPDRSPSPPVPNGVPSRTEIYVSNLPPSVDDGMLADIFGQSLHVKDAHVVTDRENGRSKGFGFVRFRTEADQQVALREFDGCLLNERKIRVSPRIIPPQRAMAHRGGGESPRGANVGKGPIDSPRSLGRQPGRRGDAPRGKALDFRARNKATNNEWRKDQKGSSSPGTARARSIERGANNECRKDRKDSPSPVRTKRQAIEKKVDAELRRKDRQPSAEDRSVTKKNKKKNISKQTTPERAGRIEEWVCQYLAGTTDGNGKLAAIGAAIPDDVFDRDIDGPLKQVLLHSTRLQIDGHDIFLVGAENPSLALEEEFSSAASALPGSSALTTETLDAEALAVFPPEESSNEMCTEKEQEPPTNFVGTREEVEAVELLVQEEGELHLEEARKLLAAVIATCIEAEMQTVDARAKEAPYQAAQEEVNAALAEVAAQEEAKKRRTEELQRKTQEGGIVQRNKAKNELAQLLEADPLPLRKARITLEAARKKAEKARAPFEAARKAAEEAEEEARRKVAEAEAFLAEAKRGAEQCHNSELSRIEMELQEQKHLSATRKSHLLFTTLNV